MGSLNHHAIDNCDVKVFTSELPVEFNSESVPDPDTNPIKWIDDDEMDHLLELFNSEHDEDIMDVDLYMLQAWLMVAPPSKLYTVSTVLFYKNGGENVAVKICMSHFSMFVPTKATVKLGNGNTGHAQWIGIILCLSPNCSIIYPVRPVYYCPGHPSNTISSGALKLYIGFKKVTYKTLKHCDFVERLVCSWISPYQTQNNLDYIQLEVFNINTHRDNNIVVPTVCGLKKNISQFIHQRFGHVSIARLRIMTRKGLMGGLPENIPELEETCPICLLTK